MIGKLKFTATLSLLLVLFVARSEKPDVQNTTMKTQDVSRPNSILFVVDDHGLDAIGAYGNPFIKTPDLDKLAYDGQYKEVFERLIEKMKAFQLKTRDPRYNSWDYDPALQGSGLNL